MILRFFIFLFFTLNISASSYEINLNPEKFAPMKCLLGVIQENSDEILIKIANKIKSVFERTKQFEVEIAEFKTLKNKKEITDLFNAGYAFVIFLNSSENSQAIEWRLYEVTQGAMVKGKKVYRNNNSLADWSYNLADEIWQAMTLKPGSFSSKISYIRRKKDAYNREHCLICVTDFDGTNSRVVADTLGIYVGLGWNNNKERPLIFCSEFTKYNVRLVSFNLDGRKKIVIDSPGTFVGTAFSPDNSEVLYCRSGEIWKYKYDTERKMGKYQCIIKNDGKNCCPNLCPNGDIIFSSDSNELLSKGGRNTKEKTCKIYHYHNGTKNIDLITPVGYCVDPSYCPVNKKIIYSKKVNGFFQLFVYDLKSKQHKQVTFDVGDKTDGSFSPCGDFIIFRCKKLGKSYIQIMHLLLNKRWTISNKNEYAESPAWS